MPLLLLLLLALAPVSAAGPIAGPIARADARDGSLEKLLEDVRRRRAEAFARLAQPVADLVARLAAGDAAEVERASRELQALGPDAACLLVRHLDPGGAPEPAERELAERVARVMESMPTRATTPALVELARSGSLEGRSNAMRLLGCSPDRAQASACLIEVYRASKGRVRADALAALARVGGPESESVLIEALGATDPDVLRAVLGALAGQRVVAARAGVRDVVTAPSAAAPLVPEILAYYRAIGAAFDDEDANALLRLASSDVPAKPARVAILEALPTFGAPTAARLRRSFDALLASSDEQLAEAAQVALARMGDRSMRRDLIKKYDELVARNDSWPTGYEKRGELLLKLGEHADAAKDYARAIKLYQEQNRPQPLDELFVELARAYARDANLRKAAETLEQAKLPRSILKRVAEDPDFRAVKEHSKYGAVLQT